MNRREFYDTVVLMREAQKNCKDNPSKEARAKAEELERMIDREIYRVTTYLAMREKLPKLDLQLMKDTKI